MPASIREYRPADEEAVVELSLRAWAPVFTSLEQTLGRELFTRLHGDWRQYQAGAVRATLSDAAINAWVAAIDAQLAGFVAASVHTDRLGEISMIAVDPDHQRAGVGRELTEHATEWLRIAGMRVAMVETGGDPGHAGARRLSQRAGYRPLPVARYFKAL